jgi:hypothetical protein
MYLSNKNKTDIMAYEQNTLVQTIYYEETPREISAHQPSYHRLNNSLTFLIGRHNDFFVIIFVLVVRLVTSLISETRNPKVPKREFSGRGEGFLWFPRKSK